MAVLGKVAGTMLKDNLVRNGVDLILDGNLMYWDVANRRVGIATTSPGNTLTVNGFVTASNVLIANNVVQSFNGNLILRSTTGNIEASSLRISNVASPIYNSDVTNKTYVDAAVAAVSYPNLYIGNSSTGNTNVILGSETLNLVGNTNQINVAITENTATFTLATSLVLQTVTITGNATVGNLTANGTGGQLVGYLTGAIGSNVANSGIFTTITTVSGGQITGYHTGAIGANTANSGAFTTLTASGTTTLSGQANLNTLTASTIAAGTIGNSGALVQGTTALFTGNVGFGSVYANGAAGSQLIGYHTGAIGANVANSGAFTTLTASSTTTLSGQANLNTLTASTIAAGTIGNSGALVQGTNAVFTGNVGVGSVYANGAAGSQFIGYLTGAIGANVANTGVFTSVTTTNGGQVTGYHTGAIGANTANTGVFTSVNTVSGGQITGYITGAIGANTANSGAFTTLTATGTVNFAGNLTAANIYAANIGNSNSLFTALNVISTNANIGNFYIYNNNIEAINTDGNINLKPIGNGLVNVNTTTAIVLPSGSNLTRPANPSIGSFRYNTANATLEYWDGYTWNAITATTYTTIVSDSFIGDGSSVNFTLTENSTTSGTLVSLNGVLQIPDTAYTITGNVLTFLEAPLSTDVIEARTVTTVSQITQLIVGNSAINFGAASNGYPINLNVSEADRVIVYPGNTTVSNTLIANAGIVSGTANVSLVQNTDTTIDSFNINTYRTAKYIVSISDFANTKFTSAELIVNHNGATPTVATYGVVTSGGSNFVTYNVSISGSTLSVKANSTSSASYCKIQQTYVPV